MRADRSTATKIILILKKHINKEEEEKEKLGIRCQVLGVACHLSPVKCH